MSKNKKQLVTLIILAAVLLAPTFWRSASNFASSVYRQVATTISATANLEANSVGVRLGNIVNDVVLDIRANNPKSYLTQAHVMALMCVELPSLNVGTRNAEGRNDGYMQITPSTRIDLLRGTKAESATGINIGQKCEYVKSREPRTGGCGTPNSLVSNPRCSIQWGSCMFDVLLTVCEGDTACAYRGYNAGNINREAYGNSQNKYASSYQQISNGGNCRSTSVWKDLWQTVYRLTNGMFKTEDAKQVLNSLANWMSTPSLNSISKAWKSGGNNAISRFFGGQTGLGGSGGSRGGSSSGNLSGQSAYENGRNSSARGEGTSGSTNKSYGIRDSGSLDGNWSDTSSQNTDTNGLSNSGSVQATYLSKEPILTCLPNKVVKNEPALIFWQCKNGSQTSVSQNFQTDGKSMGKTRINPSVTTEYELTCGSSNVSEQVTRAACNIEVINPALALVVSDTSVPMWEKVNITWNSLDTQNCKLESDDDNSKYAHWERNGTEGDVYSHSITKDTVFTLTCTTGTGMEKKKSVTVGVSD